MIGVSFIHLMIKAYLLKTTENPVGKKRVENSLRSLSQQILIFDSLLFCMFVIINKCNYKLICILILCVYKLICTLILCVY